MNQNENEMTNAVVTDDIRLAVVGGVTYSQRFVPGSVTLDVFQEGLALDTNTVRIFHMTVDPDGTLVDGDEIDLSSENVEYDVATRTLTFHIPDPVSGAYKLTMRTNVTDQTQSPFTRTQIDYPVTQGQDNRYYLKHSFQKKRSAHACIFLDWRNEPGDLSYVIYGHDMKDGTFFGSLSDFSDEQYCREHRIIELNLWGEPAQWEIFSVRVTDDTAVPVMFESFDEYAQYLEGAVEAPAFDLGTYVDDGDTILTLSTCDSGNSRLLVQAVRVK